MTTINQQLKSIFIELNHKIAELNRKRMEDGSPTIPKADVTLLGQVSLLANEKVSAILSLAQTGDIDALLQMENAAKQEFKDILKRHRFIYDEDSKLVWIPPQSTFYKIFNLKNVLVNSIDPESALVSKAIKSPEKNKQLIRQAIASGKFPNLVDRIIKNGGNLEVFAQ